LVAENGFQDFHNRKHVNVNHKVDINNNSPSVNDIDDVTCFVLSAEDKTRFGLLFWFCSKAAEL
jgi:hypothetical protein